MKATSYLWGPKHILIKNPTPFAYRVSVLTNRYVEPMGRRLEIEYGLLWHEWVVVFCLGHGGDWSATDISIATGRPKNSISRAVSKLIDQAYIARSPHPDDARVLELTLTAKGRRLYDAVVPQLQQAEEEIYSGISAEERARLFETLDKLVHQAVERER